MDYPALMQTISSVGFPIVMCMMMFIYIQKINDTHREEVDTLRVEISSLKEAISNCVVVMTQILNKLE